MSDLMFADQLRRNAEQFVRDVSQLDSVQFLSPMDGGWSPRDVVAHLIGWNRYTTQGCDQIVRGQLPFYLADEANDFSTVNARSVQRYASPDRTVLFAELETSLGELERFLTSLTAADWAGEYRYEPWSRPAAIQRHGLALADDYEVHGAEITRWAQEASGP